MRHGWEWWETFWKWLLETACDDQYTWEQERLSHWLKEQRSIFEYEWREGSVVPPKG